MLRGRRRLPQIISLPLKAGKHSLKRGEKRRLITELDRFLYASPGSVGAYIDDLRRDRYDVDSVIRHKSLW